MAELFVGRQPELSLLHEAFADVLAGRGRFVLIAGEPGIGKSRLVDEFSTGAASSGALVAWGRCWELGGAPAYWPWTEALRAIVGQRSDVATAELGQLLPELGPSAEAAPENADAARFRLFDAVVRAVRAASTDQPLVVVLEDVHTADEPSLLLLEFVVRALGSMAVLVIATYRDVDVVAESSFAAVLSELMRERATARTVLVGLGAHDVGEVIKSTTGLAASTDLAERVRDHTEGNPLYVREVARLLVTEGRLPELGERLAVPRDVRETLLRRVRQLPDQCVDVLMLAAVVGRDFPLDLVVRLRGSEVVELLDPAVAAGLILPAEHGSLRFSHAVVSEALYDAIAPALRMQLHREIAEALEQLPASNEDSTLAATAHHYSRALPLAPAEKAVDAAQQAAQRAVARLAHEEGVRLYRMAIEAAVSTDDRRVYNELLLGLGDALGRAGDGAASKLVFLEAADRLRGGDEPELFAQAALGYGGPFAWQRAADDPRVVALVREALDGLPDDDSVQRVRLLARLSGAARDDADRGPRNALSREAVEVAERVGDPDVLVWALTARWCAIWGPDAVEEQHRIAARALAVAEQTANRDRLGDALLLVPLGYVTTGDFDAMRAILARLHVVADEMGQPSLGWYSAVLTHVILLMEGKLAQAEAVIRDARDLGRKVYSWDSDASYLLAMSMLRWEQSRLVELEPEIRDAFIRFPGYRVFRCFLALCCLESGRADEARSIVEEMLAGGDETLPNNNDWLASTTLIAEVVHRLDMTDVAGALYGVIEPYGHLVGSAGGEPVTGSMQRPLGLLASVLDRTDDARAHHERALEVHTRIRAELWIAHSEFDLAEVAPERAEHLHARALRRCEALGMTALAARIKAAQGVTGPRPGGLTKREVEVAALVAGGASNRDIADALVISERTAESHVQNILTKLGFGSRSQIASWATTEQLRRD